MNNRSPVRLSFPEDEKLRPWLPLLLDAFAIIDKGVAAALIAIYLFTPWKWSESTGMLSKNWTSRCAAF